MMMDIPTKYYWIRFSNPHVVKFVHKPGDGDFDSIPFERGTMKTK